MTLDLVFPVIRLPNPNLFAPPMLCRRPLMHFQHLIVTPSASVLEYLIHLLSLQFCQNF
jgi:hypothetical protein